MSFTFEPQVTENKDKPFVMIYGPSGVGKSTLCSQADRPVFMQTEAGEGEMKLRTIKDGVFQSYDEFVAGLRYIYGNFDKLNMGTLVIDSVDHLEPLVVEKVCGDNNVASISAMPYGSGFAELAKRWQEIIKALHKIRLDKGVTIIAIAHDVIRSVNDPTVDPYDAHDLKLSAKAVALWKENADMIGLLRTPVMVDAKSGKAKGGSQPTLYTRPSAFYTAKTRYEDMPSMIPIPRENGWAEVSKYIAALKV